MVFDSVKRLIDIAASFAGLLVLSPILLVLAVVNLCIHGRPILFSQVRPGLYGKPFKIYKFRSMLDTKDKNGQPLEDHLRVTRFGSFLRASSLDELPALWNVRIGEMSLVGPRPLLMQYLPRYSPEQARRHEVKPGITGLAQVGGRNAISWDQKFALDVEYVDSRSLAMDFSILVQTFVKVFKRQDINHSDQVTMPEFMGNEKVEGSRE